MLSKYDIFCKVVEHNGFTKAANVINYSQSAVSQTVKNLEQEMGFTLLIRGKEGIHLTADGKEMYPYIQAIAKAEQALERRQKELRGLFNSEIRIGTFTSVSRNLLPGWMAAFKESYPSIRFVLEQGEYTTIPEWVEDDAVDFGFVNLDATPEWEGRPLYSDEMCAVMPLDHPLTRKLEVSLADLAEESLILLDEGEFNSPLRAFEAAGLAPNIDYEVYDDYTIIAMIEEGLGVSIMYRRVLNGYEDKVAIRPIAENIRRRVGIIWKNWDVLPIAARQFIEHILAQFPEDEEDAV
ncbi:MAG: LysR family transcriptional regulator [Peptococcaceae bacterium]|nr:LysR family transcriptional regulator [Peptococcaceae bacterium]